MDPTRITVPDALDAARTRLGYTALPPTGARTLVDVFETAVRDYADRPAFTCLGHTISYRDLDVNSAAFAAWLQRHTDLQPGDRIALQLPNCLQFPIALYGALRAGLVVVNTNPLYTPPEMEHQFTDADVRAIVILANMASKLEGILPVTGIKHVVVTELADLHPAPRRYVINAVLRHVKRAVPPFHLPGAISWRSALAAGRSLRCQAVVPKPEDVALLQYTGGTTGVSKGAMLSHANLVANMQQCEPFLHRAGLVDGQESVVAPLPLYHVYAFMLHCVTMLAHGNHNLLIPNPRDIEAFVRELQRARFSVFVGLNTLFNALLNHDGFREIDFSALKLTLSGGMALTGITAQRWKDTAGCQIVEGYGLTESSPVLTLNPPEAVRLGSIGIALPGTDIKIISNDGQELLAGEAGELCARGPQVMQGYWRRPEATATTLIDGWLHTGDIASVDLDGYIRIVDRKKDLIIVSGFNVYPNEVEDVMATHPEVLECAVVGVPDDVTGEAVKLYVVPRSQTLDEDQLRTYARARLTGYKVPRHVEFRENLPKTNVGKVLRRELREKV
jgi:long-chain acyl-CoA synthetase